MVCGCVYFQSSAGVESKAKAEPTGDVPNADVCKDEAPKPESAAVLAASALQNCHMDGVLAAHCLCTCTSYADVHLRLSLA